MNDPAPRDSERADEAVVDSEWRKIEAERIALEQEEAREDLRDAEPRRRSWPWLALAAALVAGLVAAAVVNARAKAPKPMTDSAQPPAGGRAKGQPQ